MSTPKRSYRVYLHADDDHAYEAARDAGYTDEQVIRLGLDTVGYEEVLEVTVLDPDRGPVNVRHIPMRTR